ncbi:tRNA/rRNA methyltransferase [Desulfobaculum xiamenense]|uniref:tRNA (cytidine/uridine-2'-O-)-methyltransferase TrmJ n=1 Tax=Desulfobaculum xiamenense TaxID=995050 RepID=A0A846QP73_9BACT|nr:RNA methyltransferase [Desulfobaculum xiamenense]NJB68282.1 tRNA/rRNA methyltransferase [Desulfobaculum xiamenense]
MLDNLTIVLFHPKFPENVGSAARACANMGCPNLVVVSPRNWDMGRAGALATPKGEDILRSMRVVDDLPTALAGFQHVYGTTARTGGWRKGLWTPSRAASEMVAQMQGASRVAVVFGPEDRGLTNEETEICGRLLTIPTSPEASSLNLAQAVLVVLYECFKHSVENPEAEDAPAPTPVTSNLATHEEMELLFANLKDTLAAIDYLKDENTDYWMLPVRRFLQRAPFRRSEFNMLMGICRQVKWVADKASRSDG